MPVTLNSTGITFSDGSSQNSAVTDLIVGASQTFNNPTTIPTSTASGYYVGLVGGGGGGSWRAPSVGGQGGAGVGFVSATSINNPTFNVTVGAGGPGVAVWAPTAPAGGATNIAGAFTANGGNAGRGIQPNQPGNTGSFQSNLGGSAIIEGDNLTTVGFESSLTNPVARTSLTNTRGAGGGPATNNPGGAGQPGVAIVSNVG